MVYLPTKSIAFPTLVNASTELFFLLFFFFLGGVYNSWKKYFQNYNKFSIINWKLSNWYVTLKVHVLLKNKILKFEVVCLKTNFKYIFNPSTYKSIDLIRVGRHACHNPFLSKQGIDKLRSETKPFTYPSELIQNTDSCVMRWWHAQMKHLAKSI